MRNKKDLISIVTISYNHEQFIADAIESFLMQHRDNFDIEVIIADDASTDNTQRIISEYADKYPSIIHPILRKRNVGVRRNLLDAMEAAKGKYIALCEGDDYWIDPQKLDRQYRYMIKHDDCTLCFHQVEIVSPIEAENGKLFPDTTQSLQKFNEYTLLDYNYIQTNSVMYKNLKSYKDIIKSDALPLEWFLHIYHAKKGSIKYIGRPMSVYRKHPNGIWWRTPEQLITFWRNNIPKLLNTYDAIEQLYDDDEKAIEIIKKSRLCAISMACREAENRKEHVNPVLKYVSDRYPQDLFAIALNLQGELEEKRYAIDELQANNMSLEKERQRLREGNYDLQQQRHRLMEELSQIKESKSYRFLRILGRILRKTLSILRRGKMRVRNMQMWIVTLPLNVRTRRTIKSALKGGFDRGFSRRSTGAIILHLYYDEMWPMFRDRLKYLVDEKRLDLYVNVQLSRYEVVKREIKRDYPDAQVFAFPNQGRDVLPFLSLLPILKKMGYDYYLKIHSKKSPQRHDGTDWAKQIFDNLIISDSTRYSKLSLALNDEKTSIIGPAGNYVPLPTYYNDNHPMILNLTRRIMGRKIAEELDRDKWNYGFFAGTMFWARIQPTARLLDANIKAWEFAQEGAQLDGTIAHAIERVLCVIPELEGYNIYEISEGKLSKISYHTDFTPEWSDHYTSGE